ncbi:PAS/PAC and GAF sensor-containing diguanylate cyclase/phosphodiesterase [Mycobacterium sp. PO1]|nr:PAS/PAC and GAF sensor-containing diguanylate cyclase/phosphodiesterase [Mycobacterium sp. PO1]GFM22794.1 PAS/PAC and GAF sensor-containing diguanylate cyclase/phosphodiesterase [Mycobacterium sp. PO2]
MPSFSLLWLRIAASMFAMLVDGAGGLPAAESETPVDLIRTMLSVLRRRLGLETAWLSSFRDDVQVFEVLDGNPEAMGLSCGAGASLAGSYCVRVIDGRLPSVIPDTSVNETTAILPITGELDLGAYVGVPVVGPDGSALGMVCAVSRQASPHLVELDLRIVERVAELIGLLIEPPSAPTNGAADRHAAVRRVVAQRDFEVVFQPVHDVHTATVVGLEALARFPCEPFRPDAFLAQAASLGLGTELETAILTRVLSLLPQLPDDVFIAVNISPAAVQHAPWTDLLDCVDPTRIVLEITEHAAVENYGALDDALDVCRARGVRVAVDDVGAGFSSFSHVLELNPDFVKIDKSIIRNIDSDAARRRLAQAICEFAAQTGATDIAEGVETQAELDAVGAAGIRCAQGYYLGRPKSHVHGFASAAVSAMTTEAAPAALDLLGERRFELALAHSPIGMAVVDLDGAFLRTNRAMHAMLGYTGREMARLNFRDITHPDDLDADLSLMHECLAGKRRSYHIAKRYITADGRVVWGALTVVLVCGPSDRPHCFISQILDVTAERVREADLVRRADTDPLTTIANRAAAWSRLEELDARDAGYGVLFCDIERFKSVNDRSGHHAGDHMLVEVAERLLAAIGPDDLVARWGGDEFLVVTESVDDDDLALLAGRIADRMERTPVTLADGTDVPVTLTIGVCAHRRGDGRSIDDVLALADEAMYRKRRSRL